MLKEAGSYCSNSGVGALESPTVIAYFPPLARDIDGDAGRKINTMRSNSWRSRPASA